MLDGKLVPGIGGGICQVSSTLFNAALESGMEIVERTPHFEPVGYIPKGRDATVAWGYLDFQFKNPYSHPIYILSTIDHGTLSIYIIGSPTDKPRQVSISVGNEIVLPHGSQTKFDQNLLGDRIEEGTNGSEVTTWRHIIRADGQTYDDSFQSLYDPQDTIIIKGRSK
ncbi:MAG: VanW family protein [Veillonella sp.]|nr:VanW family protein [Veillonella sp.]